MIMKKLVACLAAVSVIFSQLSIFAETAPAETEPNTEADQVVAPSQTENNFVLPKNVRGTMITPTVDFLKEDYEGGTVADELDALYAGLSEIGLNAVYINTVYEDKAYYSTDMNLTGEDDYIALALSKAEENNFRAYLVFDLEYELKSADENADKLDWVISDAHRFALKYKCDGILIDNYYSEKSSESYTDYMQNGSGIGYDNWLYDSNEMYISAVSEVIHITDNSIPVGILIKDMWANIESNEEGSDTKDPVQALYDGFSNTKKYVEKGYVDFVAVNAYGSLTSSSLPFENVTEWWNDLAEVNGITLYVVHFNEYQGQQKEGWAGIDQLLKQLTVVKDLSAFGGSVFHSCYSLFNDKSVTDNITKFYGDQINEDTLFEELKMQSPSKLNFVTYEPYVDFMGTFDENFEVLFNGMNVTLNSAGNFYFEEPLDIGMNKFTFEHKGTVYTYHIERKIITIKELDSSIANGKSLTVNGGSRIEIACSAYEGATVTATLNGKTIALKESDSKTDDDINSSYRRFVGYYTVPEGIIGQEQDLGTILVSSEYAGYKQSLYGASVKVMALPEPPKPIETVLGDQNSAGSGEVVGTMDPVHSETETVQYVKVSKDYTTVYNGNSLGSAATPDFAQLPAGTLDYLLTSSGDFYITESGKRLKQIDATSFSDTGLGKNSLVVKSTGTSGNYSYFKIKLDYKISYNIEFVGNNYYSGGDGDFYLNDFTATKVYITFDNITSVTKLPSFEYNYVFSSGVWETVTVDGIPKFRMVLTLRQPGVYSGCGATYDDDGDLLLKFKILTNSLQGMTIGIDPGHGYTREGVFDPGSIGYIREVEANLPIAKELESQLKALGANVVRLKTESEVAVTPERPNILRAYGIDMFISIHSNKMKGVETARGTEAYYFTPYSQPLASAISYQIADYFTHNVYSDGADKNRGAKYSYYWVTLQQDFPSILVETAFVSNEEDALAIADPTHQKNIAARIVKGIQAYIGRSNISAISGGSSQTEPEQTTPEVTEEPPVVTTAAETGEPDVTTELDITTAEQITEPTSETEPASGTEPTIETEPEETNISSETQFFETAVTPDI